MNEAINKAEALVDAHEYIRRFNGKTVVVKVGGSIMDQADTFNSLIVDVCFLKAVGVRPIVVHGGGKHITAAMEKVGLEAHFVQGRRYTDERALAIVEHVLVQEVNQQIVKKIDALGHKAMGLHSLSSCVVFAKRLFLRGEGGDGAADRKVDVGLVGEVEWVNVDLLHALLDADSIPVIAPVSRDSAGGKLNVNADSVAGHVAAAINAEKLVLVSDTHGIRTNPDDPHNFACHLSKSQSHELIERGVIAAGMLPKVEASLMALEAGVNKAHIIDGRIAHALLLEIYTTEGIGTEIVLE